MKICRPKIEIMKQKLLNLKLRKEMLDNGKCVRCGIYGVLLHTHHINKNKFDHRKENLEVRCPQCHRRVHIAPWLDKIDVKRKPTVGRRFADMGCTQYEKVFIWCKDGIVRPKWKSINAM